MRHRPSAGPEGHEASVLLQVREGADEGGGGGGDGDCGGVGGDGGGDDDCDCGGGDGCDGGGDCDDGGGGDCDGGGGDGYDGGGDCDGGGGDFSLPFFNVRVCYAIYVTVVVSIKVFVCRCCVCWVEFDEL